MADAQATPSSSQPEPATEPAPGLEGTQACDAPAAASEPEVSPPTPKPKSKRKKQTESDGESKVSPKRKRKTSSSSESEESSSEEKSKKRKRLEDKDASLSFIGGKKKARPANVTLHTQADICSPGLAASKCVPMRDYLRLDGQKKSSYNQSIQKPRGVEQTIWDSISTEEKTLFVIFYRLCKSIRVKQSPESLPNALFDLFKKRMTEAQKEHDDTAKELDDFLQLVIKRNQRKLVKASRKIEKEVKADTVGNIYQVVDKKYLDDLSVEMDKAE